ncbi:MAG: tRNA methyl transferase PRC-barrel domain-containing protein, partial [Pseudomonadota bacterium]
WKYLTYRLNSRSWSWPPLWRVTPRAAPPSPCVLCNPAVKFGLLRQRARAWGINYVATGHYAALVQTGPGQGLSLVRAFDRTKDQTYFLSRLTPEILSQAVFPLAGLTKVRVREKAAALGLPAAAESREICFLAGENYREFILARLGPEASEPGDFVDVKGRVVGRHKGLINYTVGQRRGLNLPGPEPYYVLALDRIQNRVVLGTKEQTHSTRFTVADLVWSVSPPGPQFRALVQIRSRHHPAPASVVLNPDRGAEVIFDQPQPAITSGQAAAFYDRHLVLGGGWIDRTTFDIQPPGLV